METLINLKSFKDHSPVYLTATFLDKITILVVSPDKLDEITGEITGEDADKLEHTPGYTDFTTGTIYINNSLSIDMQRRAVSHELVEWCNELCGLGLSHTQISVLGQFFHSLICHE